MKIDLTPYRWASGDEIEAYVLDGWTALIQILFGRINLVFEHRTEGMLTGLYLKEKFGGLRFYFQYDAQVLHEDRAKIAAIIDEMKDLSFTICEVCGKPGKTITKKDWYRTRCEKHETE